MLHSKLPSTEPGSYEDKYNIEIIRNRERAELLVISEIKGAKSEVLFATSSAKYLEHLASLGIVDRMEQAHSNGTKILVLCSRGGEQVEASEDNVEFERLFSSIRRYAQLSTVETGIKGTIAVIDNSRVISISEENIDAVAIYSTNKSLVNNFGSLFESLWGQAELLRLLIEAHKKVKIHDRMQREFIDVAAHELRTPMQPLLGLINILQTEVNGKSAIVVSRKDIDLLARNAERLERLSSDILTVTKMEGGKIKLNLESFDIKDKLQTVVNDVKRTMSVGNAIEFVCESPSIIIQADRSKIFEVISNLIGNAIKFTNTGKIIASASTSDDGKEVIIRVTDTGTGIHPDIMPRLFTKFASKADSGTGLGLYIAKGIVEAHGGRIWAENNRDGKGAMFAFSLPLPIVG